MPDYNKDLYPKRSKLATIIYWILMAIVTISSLSVIYLMVIQGINTQEDMKIFFMIFIIVIYCGIGVIMLEKRPQITQSQIKYHKRVLKMGGLVIVLWTLASSLLVFIFFIHDGRI